MSEINSPHLYLVDVSNYLFRSFYALPVMTNAQRQPVQAVFGLARSLIQLQLDFAPSHLLVVFDGINSKARRRLIYPEYKANRLRAPQELIDQFPLALELCQQMGLSVVNREEYEADDLIAAAVHQAVAQSMPCTICSSDKDLLQLVGDQVDQLYTFKNNERVGAAQILATYGITPSQIADWLALCGDASDNIPGVAGIGPKTAVQLLNRYGTIEGIIAHLHEQSPKRQETFDVESARISYQLAQLQNLDDWTLDLDQVKRHVPSPQQWTPWFEKMGFRSLIKLMHKLPLSPPSDKGIEPFQRSFSQSIDNPPVEAKSPLSREPHGHLYITSSDPDSKALAKQVASLQGKKSPILKAEGTSHAVKSCDSFEQLDLFAPRQSPVAFKSSCQVSALQLVQHLLLLPAGSDLWIECLSDLKRGQKRDLWLFYTPLGLYWMKAARHSIKPETDDGDSSCEAKSREGIGREWDATSFALALQRLKLHAYSLQPLERLWLEWGQKGRLPWCEDLRLRAYLLFADGRHFDANSLLSHYEIVPLARSEQMDEQLFELVEGKATDSEGTEYSDWDVSELLNERFKAWRNLLSRLQLECDPQIEKLYQEVELPLASVLARMEGAGIGVESEKLEELSIELRGQLQIIEKEIFQLADCQAINLNSPKQLAQLLYEKLALRVVKSTKTGPSTDAQALEELYNDHPVIAQILRYRELEKLRSTYVDALPSFVSSKTLSIHPHFEQAVTSTGRLSCHEPNLQNIPVRSPEGMRIRQAFVARSPHHRLLSADYSQIELRMMAHLSGDENLTAAFIRGEDIHRYTAALVFEIPLDQVSDEQRALAKAVNFGILYGQQAFGLSRQLHIPVSKASRFIEAYFERYKAVAAYIKECRAKATELGFVTTLLGRKRYIPQIRSAKAVWRQLGERLCVNTCVQGSAADLIKLAMLRIDELLESVESQMILQVHDELIFECPEAQIKPLQTLVQERMCQAVTLKVPLVVNIAVGKNWMEC